MQAHRRDRQALFAPPPLHLQSCGQAIDFLLDLRESHHRIELGNRTIGRARLRFRRRHVQLRQGYQIRCRADLQNAARQAPRPILRKPQPYVK